MVELLRGGSERAKLNAAGTLRSLANNNANAAANAAATAAAGGVTPLEQLARDGDGKAKEWASEVLEKVRPAAEAQKKEKEEAAAARSKGWKAERVAAGVDERMPKRPEDHSCPITYEVMTDPVTAGDGMTYERAAIEQWLSNRNNSPSTGAELPHKIVVPNQALKSIIRDWEEQEHNRCMAMAQAAHVPSVARQTTDTLPTDELAARAARAQAELTRRRQLAAASAVPVAQEEGGPSQHKQAAMEKESELQAANGSPNDNVCPECFERGHWSAACPWREAVAQTRPPPVDRQSTDALEAELERRKRRKKAM